MLEHGGRLRLAAEHYSIPLQRWLDLSTGINPTSWPVPALPDLIWLRLPETEDGLTRAAEDYYGCEHVLPVAGSQAAIHAIPRLRTSSRVGVLQPGYAEHALAWQQAGHQVMPVRAEAISESLHDLDVLVLIHPNNPTGTRFDVEQLLTWHGQLTARGGCLVVDEAFMDTTPEHSLVAFTHRPGLIVLRSLGKFFGLAGARVGFVCAQPAWLKQLDTLLGPWTISSPARYVAAAALSDHHWQRHARTQLIEQGKRLALMLARYQLIADGGCALFQWVCCSDAAVIHQALAHQGILTRLFAEPPSLRFGLPGSEAGWQRLATALATVRR